MLVITTVFLSHLFLRSWWRRALLVAAAIPLSVAKNGLRIVTIAELGTRVDHGFLTGRLHHHGGIVFFGIAVVAVGALLFVLRRTESQTSLAHSARV
jgi:exosortase/archaeosortase family protein